MTEDPFGPFCACRGLYNMGRFTTLEDAIAFFRDRKPKPDEACYITKIQPGVYPMWEADGTVIRP